jgi:very-short-patch-repair endonuclease
VLLSLSSARLGEGTFSRERAQFKYNKGNVRMTTKQIFNTSRQTPIRQTLRNNLTTPEQKLWTRIRNKQLGVRFRRQYGIDRYVVDFYCPELALVIELDGNSHYEEGAQEYDQVRDAFMESLGLRVLRFTNLDVMNNIDGVLVEICKFVGKA